MTETACPASKGTSSLVASVQSKLTLILLGRLKIPTVLVMKMALALLVRTGSILTGKGYAQQFTQTVKLGRMKQERVHPALMGLN